MNGKQFGKHCNMARDVANAAITETIVPMRDEHFTSGGNRRRSSHDGLNDEIFNSFHEQRYVFALAIRGMR